MATAHCKPIPKLSEEDIARFWEHVHKGAPDECWPYNGTIDNKGYGIFTIHEDPYKAQRIAYFLTHGEPGNLFVLHRCDNPPCCNEAHLFRGTIVDNLRDMIQKNRHSKGETHGYVTHPEVIRKGEQHHKAKLTEDNVREIRAMLTAGVKPRFIYRRFHITYCTLLNIKTRRTWRHLSS